MEVFSSVKRRAALSHNRLLCGLGSDGDIGGQPLCPACRAEEAAAALREAAMRSRAEQVENTKELADELAVTLRCHSELREPLMDLLLEPIIEVAQAVVKGTR